MLTLGDVLEIENTPEILGFTCPGTDHLLWPFVRTLVIRMILDREIFGEGTLVKLNSKWHWGRVARCVGDGFFHNLRSLNTQSRIVFFNTGLTNVRIDGEYFNRVSDYFASCFPESTLLIEDHFEWEHSRPRANKRLIYHVPYTALLALVARNPARPINENVVQNFVRFVASRLQRTIGVQLTERQKDFLYQALLRRCRSLATELYVYERLYRRLDARLILFEDGFYGTRGAMIGLAKEMGITTAEMQHGMISAGHEAYNYAPVVLQSEHYRKYAPDYFLVYGQWWGDQIRCPSKIVAIGNPHYEEMKQKCAATHLSKDQVLLLSNGLTFDTYFEMARQLKKHIKPEYRILVRPHPLEKKSVRKRYQGNTDGIQIDDSDNLYERLSRSYAVVGEISTALFEAIGLSDRIFAWNSAMTAFGMPDCPFDRFDNASHLSGMLFADGCGRIDEVLTARIWTRGWKANYKQFVTQTVCLSDLPEEDG